MQQQQSTATVPVTVVYRDGLLKVEPSSLNIWIVPAKALPEIPSGIKNPDGMALAVPAEIYDACQSLTYATPARFMGWLRENLDAIARSRGWSGSEDLLASLATLEADLAKHFELM